MISSPITFVAGIAMAINCGAKPDFVDIDSNTFNIDPNKLETKLKKENQSCNNHRFCRSASRLGRFILFKEKI